MPGLIIGGQSGVSLWSGPTAPSDSMGSNGDLYLDTTTMDMYGPKTAGAWGPAGDCLIGPEGPAGDDGTAATVAVGSVTTGAPGSSATVVNAGTPTAATLNFSIPRGDVGSPGGTGPAGLSTVAPSTSARTLGTTFQPNASKAVLCSYSVNTQATNPLLAGSSSATVTLLSDAVNPPTTERCRSAASSSVGLAVAVAITTSNTTPLTYICPPGHYVRLVSSTSGTAATSIVSQTEETLG